MPGRECCFSTLGRHVTHPKFSSYVKANPALEKQEMNLCRGQGDHGSATISDSGGRTLSLGRGFPGLGYLQRARWLFGESVTNHSGVVIDWQSHQPDHK